MKMQYKNIRALTQSKNKALKSKVITQAKILKRFNITALMQVRKIKALKVLTV